MQHMKSEVMANYIVADLGALYPFSDPILNRIGLVADEYNRLDYRQLLAKASVPPVQRFESDGNESLDVLDIIPKGGEYDSVLVVHPPMGGSLNPDRVVRAVTASLVMPDRRLITVSNPGEIGFGGGKLPFANMPKVAHGDLRPTVDSTLRYLESQGIDTADHAGGSFGGQKTVVVPTIAHQYDQTVGRIVSIDPPTVKQRTLGELKDAFVACEDALPAYVEASGSKAYVEARKLGGGRLSYKAGLLRPSNLAIALALRNESFEGLLAEGLKQIPEMKAAVLWADESELCENALMTAIVSRTQKTYGTDRIWGASIPGQRHAMTNHLYLNAALMAEGLEDRDRTYASR